MLIISCEEKGSMKKFSDSALKLLLKYGVGCLPEEKRKEAEYALKTNEFSESFVKQLFPLAYSYLTSKEKIDENQVREYFLDIHNFLVESTGKKDCLVRVAKVVKAYSGECDVEIDGRIERLKCLEKFEEGDLVLVHVGYVVEKYDENLHSWKCSVRGR